MIFSIFLIIGCQTATTEEKKSNSIVEDPTGEYNSKRFVINSMLYLNRSGRIFIYDRQEKQEIATKT